LGLISDKYTVTLKIQIYQALHYRVNCFCYIHQLEKNHLNADWPKGTLTNQATLLLSSAYKSLLNPTQGYKQTFPLPLAICNPTGQMRTCNKALFKEALENAFPNSQTFLPHCPILQSPHELIVDFLYMLHQPPPPHVTTFSSYAKYLWDRIVIKLGTRRGANVIRIVVDKPAYLPKPRDLLHEKRTGKTGKLNVDECGTGTLYPHNQGLCLQEGCYPHQASQIVPLHNYDINYFFNFSFTNICWYLLHCGIASLALILYMKGAR
jgi:hypothetical protein